ncbi:MAG: rhomboid family intramembrane serine protease [Flavobacteriaceae bacterium]|nr:rhomboid family intramembrane serine protease [Flavobacteriaceae bacterium]
MWIVFLYEIKFGFNFNHFSIYPRKLDSLLGILASPFLHSDLSHITNNTLSFFVLMLMVRYFYSKNYLRVFILGVLVSGFFTWLIARPAYHLGMSGVIYVLASFIISKSFFSKQYNLIAISFAVIFLYGSMIWYVFPIDSTISWEGHLSGLITGVLLSFFFKNELVKEEFLPLTIQQSLFLEHFDHKGKFVANLPFLDENGNLIIDEEE